MTAAGLRYPLKMLLLLIFELLWEAYLGLAKIAPPLWRTGRIDEALTTNTLAAGMEKLERFKRVDLSREKTARNCASPLQLSAGGLIR